MDLIKGERTTLRQLGLDEKWLQKVIAADPSILRLGELFLIDREKSQVSGGRIDFVMLDQKEGIQYEIEVMLGPLDESHIIRTIEYWDVERMRFRKLEHRAVIIAEEITTRFFNVIWLLNRAVPIIAIELQAIKINEKLLLNFAKILNIADLNEEERTPVNDKQTTNREYWQKRTDAILMAVADKIITFIPKDKGEPRVTYNQGHIAIGASGNNFMWFQPRRNAWLVEALLEGDEKKRWVTRLTEAGLQADSQDWGVRVRLSQEQFTKNEPMIREFVQKAEEVSRP